MKLIPNILILNKFKRAQKEIGYKLVFTDIPDIWVNGMMELDMTSTWQKFGLDIKRGVNHFTVGQVKNGVSTRYVSGELQYQSWLGGYMIKLKKGGKWKLEDHLNLAVADQRSWLKRYGDPNPVCDFVLEESQVISPIKLGKYTGVLGNGVFISHSDVGNGYSTVWLKLSAWVMSMVIKNNKPALRLSGKMLRPSNSGKSYETLKLKGYMAIFSPTENVKIVLYGCGIARNNNTEETFKYIKNDVMRAFNGCKIVKLE